MLTHVDLFSGIGGFALAARWHGMQTVGFCERDSWCQRVLAKHWPGVPIHGNIKSLEGDAVRSWLAGHNQRRPDLLTGGFPCQPFSHAGKRLGETDDRALWPEMLRIISDVRPRWVLGENVTGIISLGLDSKLS